MQPLVLYSLSGLAIAVFFVAAIFAEGLAPRRAEDPLDSAVNVTDITDDQSR